MRCYFCGRNEEDCPGGIWRGGRNGSEGVCAYCARAALRALDPFGTASGTVRLLPRLRPDPPDAA